MTRDRRAPSIAESSRAWRRRRCIGLLLILLVTTLWISQPAAADPKRVFMAPDDHTDYFWSATDVEYRQFFLTMLDYYIDQAQATAFEVPQFQSRFSADGSLWLWEYEKNKSTAEFQRLVDTIKSGHISAPKNPLVITYGGVPVEAVIRSMYYSGQLERRYGLDFPLAIAMENAGMSFGLGAVWAGSGVKYSWKGVCGCFSLIPDLDDREHEIYSWLGPDGSRILMKWNSLLTHNESIGGYAEARVPENAIDIVTRDAGFIARYPYETIGVFGQGWDDLLTTNLRIQQVCKNDSDPERSCIVSNSIDFFEEFDQRYGATIPTISAGFGNEWDLSPASLAEVSARVKRSLERLRSAEAMATLVSLVSPAFMDGREAARDQAFMNMGLYFEHDFEDGGPRVPGSARIAWQRQVATQIEQYVNSLLTDATSAMGARIQKTGADPRFFAFNSLSWARTDVADLPYGGALPVHVVDLTTGAEVPSQVVTVDGVRYVRIEAPNIPSVGYKVFEVRAGAGQVFANAPTASASTGVMENDLYRITVSPRGAITSFVDKRQGNREFVGTTGGFALNDLGPAGGSLQVENAGAVSVTLVATSPSPLAHVTRITLTRGSDRVAIRNEVTQNFGGTQRWRFSLNLTSPDVRHEEVGAIARARLTTNGGSYAPRNARYDFLTLNHFADMSGAGSVGMTLSNADAYFMQVGNSGVTTLDTTTPQLSVVIGASARPSNPILNQAGDSYFLQRFALQSHGPYDQAAAMRFALAHQNPLTAGAVSGGSPYPEASHSFLSISDPNVLLWSLKPAEEGIGEGVVARVWNLTETARNFSLALNQPVTSAKRIWHTETDRDDATVSSGALTSSIAQNQLLTYRLFPASLPTTVKIVASNARAVEGQNNGSFTISRTGSVAVALDVAYTVSGTATPGADYQALSGTARIPAGASSVVVPVVPLPDQLGEPDETVVVTLAPGAYQLGLWKSAAVTVVNAATPPVSTAVLFPFAEGGGATTADVSGQQLGTLQNGTAWTTGRYGPGLSFDGVDDNVSVPDSSSLDLGGTGTIEAWFRLNSLNRWHGVISKGPSNTDAAHNYALEIDSANRFLCILGNGSSALKVTSTATAAAGQFYHLACTWDGTAVRLYVNGALSVSAAQSITPAPNSQPLFIGQFGTGFDRLHGVIDEVRIYNRARVQADVQADMNTPIASTPPPQTFALTVTKTGTGTGTVTGTTPGGTVVTCGTDCGESLPSVKGVTL
jgi:alpha-mannosidase